MTGERNRRRIGPWWLLAAGGLAGTLIALSAWRMRATTPNDLHLLTEDIASPDPLTPEMEAKVAAFCGDCHALPRPQSFPRDRWHWEVMKGYESYAQSGRTDLDPPPFYQTLAYYRSRSPREVAAPNPMVESSGGSPVNFRVEGLNLGHPAGVAAEIAQLQWASLTSGQGPRLLACDMKYGQIVAIDVRPGTREPTRRLARLIHPCRLAVCDFNGDGALDILVADLGSYLPADHDRGRVVLLEQQASGAFEEVILAAGLGRVADVRPADFDGDGDLDVLVAEFGWLATGRVLLLENVSERQELRFRLAEVDDHPGVIHVPVYDFSGDGQPDFAALISQEYERVDLFINQGQRRFHRSNAWAAEDLTFGFSGIELADLDGDGDMDVLYTNGDAFDNGFASPWHGVGWLENQGNLQFVHHRLTEMAGAYRALPADMDADGDLDILVTAWLPTALQPEAVQSATSGSIVLLEQTQPNTYQAHVLERGYPHYVALELADFDGDGDCDFAVASAPNISRESQDRQDIAVWWNELRGE